eukprot:scaffold7262_cov144-Chaetoceros_neogracile.AAC.1
MVSSFSIVRNKESFQYTIHKTQYKNLKDRLGLLYEIILRLLACRRASALKLPIYEHLHGSDKVIRNPKPQALQPLLSSGMEL